MKPFANSLLKYLSVFQHAAKKPLTKWEKRLSLFLLAPFIAGAPLALGDSGAGAATPGSSPAAKSARTPTPLNIPIPVGHDAETVKLPYFDVHGKLQMTFYITKALRLDPDHLDLTEAYVQTYDDKGAPDLGVSMTRSKLDLTTRIVTSDLPVTVYNSDFQIAGQKMSFNSQTHTGHMSGHVHMVVYNLQGATGAPSPSPAPAETPQ